MGRDLRGPCIAIPLALLIAACSDSGTDTGSGYGSSYSSGRTAAEDTALPIRWHVGEVDPRFGVSESEFRTAIERAIRLWEDAAEQELFRYDPNGGMPIHLRYDHRQQKRQQRFRDDDRIAELARELARADSAYEDALARYEAAKSAYERRADALDWRIGQHNRNVDYWNARGGAPSYAYREIEAESARIRAEGASIDSELRRVQAVGREVDRLGDAHNALVERHNAEVKAYNARYTDERVDEGEFVQDFLGRRIVVYIIENGDHLAQVLAHEIGHALGIDHIDDAAALMRSLYGEHESFDLYLSDSDLRALRLRLAELR